MDWIDAILSLPEPFCSRYVVGSSLSEGRWRMGDNTLFHGSVRSVYQFFSPVSYLSNHPSSQHYLPSSSPSHSLT